MAFLTFPFYFAEDNFEEKENLKLPVKHEEGFMTINTQCIVSYNEIDEESILVRMANGDAYNLPIGIEDFEDILMESEAIIDLTTIHEN